MGTSGCSSFALTDYASQLRVELKLCKFSQFLEGMTIARVKFMKYVEYEELTMTEASEFPL